MKRLLPNATFAAAALGFALLALPGRAGLPQPMCVFFGQARDGFGLPYRTNADVILLRGTNEVARHSIRGSLAPGVNFALYVHLDEGRVATRYSPRALRSGEVVSIRVHDADGEKTIMESATIPPAGLPGELVLVNVTAAQDADGDSLPDLWESELIAWSGGALKSLWDVRGEDDFDGDGMSNREEYFAGTFAFLDYDALIIEQAILAASDRLRLTFLTVPGKSYHVSSLSDLAQADWQPCGFALTEAGATQTPPVEGNGGWLSLYVPLEEPNRFYRVVAE